MDVTAAVENVSSWRGITFPMLSSSLSPDRHHQRGIEALVLELPVPVEVAARVAYHPAVIDLVVEAVLRMLVHPQRRHLEEFGQYLVDEAARGSVLRESRRKRLAMRCMVGHHHRGPFEPLGQLSPQPGAVSPVDKRCHRPALSISISALAAGGRVNIYDGGRCSSPPRPTLDHSIHTQNSSAR